MRRPIPARRATARLATAAAGAAAIALVLAGCGTTDAARDDTSGGGDALTVIDSRGQEVVLENGPATRVVGTEWNVVENLLALGVMPAGVADIPGYQAWVNVGELDDSVEDIGTRGEPSMDTIAEIDPDLVVATDDLTEDTIAQLEKYYPVVVVRSADSGDQIAQAIENLELIAEATGTEDAAEGVVAEFETAVADGTAALEAAGLAGAPVGFADGWVEDGNVSLRPYTGGSLIGSVNEALGLTTPWTVEGDAAYGLAQTDVEGLTNLPADTTFVYIANDADGGDPFVDALSGNAVWESLPWVQAGQVDRLDDGIWMFGGPASMTLYANALVATLTA